ncbi:hypothetical protein [Oceanirhabdus seepicola]|uniref:Lipoprotein n=1 Tax=Oceanirhabdus seepicola TaxID=2828781 RepID=A0A9J6P302_9CLOT|nr:hypothetical protein [Oceanirhabdus seepicola]MCM1990261.1 hypothetical protein [Oceanirhabdus seepicola]
MKRISVSFLFLLFAVSFIACNQEITYTEEFNYLPKYEGMVIEDFKEPIEGQMGIAVYKLKDASPEDVLKKYERLLKKDGWKVTKDNKPANLTVEKENHQATIATSKTEEGTTLTIMSK